MASTYLNMKSIPLKLELHSSQKFLTQFAGKESSAILVGIFNISAFKGRLTTLLIFIYFFRTVNLILVMNRLTMAIRARWDLPRDHEFQKNRVCFFLSFWFECIFGCKTAYFFASMFKEKRPKKSNLQIIHLLKKKASFKIKHYMKTKWHWIFHRTLAAMVTNWILTRVFNPHHPLQTYFKNVIHKIKHC